ncbi:MAG: 3-oxoacyl-[acyl-carrier-protein] reductase [Lachnospiraceae bacterium]|nr:3-oxoacyl-[acyl-carrier-protein] reductase [Lachnospiraceae bacterium]
MFKDKTVIVTGAASGIGQAIAVEFASLGANIALCYHSRTPETTLALCEEKGAKTLAVQGDVSDFNFAKEFTKKVKDEFGTIDVLVNNAGITNDMLLVMMKEEEFDNVITTNLKGTFNMVKHVASFMVKKRTGAIINIASVVGITGNAGQANYAASKAGVIGLTKSAAKELAARGITCNAVAPGFIETSMTEILTDDQKAEIFKNVPIKRGGQPEEVAKAVSFLASQSYITGQVLNVDGGMVM